MHARRLTYILFALTFVLLLLGGVVHTTGSSLACPDWPLCYGEVFPAMRGGILYEHSHRLLASSVGFLTLLLAFFLFRQANVALRRWSLLGVGLVIWQGVLGGLTVIYRLPAIISIAHLSTSMAFFAWTVFMIFRVRGVGGRPALRLSRKPVAIAAGLVYLQLVMGAVVRHTGSALACGIEVVQCGGAWLPATPQQWVQTGHRGLALVVFAAVIAATIKPMKAARQLGLALPRRLGLMAHTVVILQMVMGILTVKTMVHTHVVTAHLALGALLWAVMLALYFSLGPLGEEAPATQSAKYPSRELDGVC